MRQRKRSAGDHNHEGPSTENREPADTPEVIRDREYTLQAAEALRLAHQNKLAPIDPKEVRADKRRTGSSLPRSTDSKLLPQRAAK
jgi:hypothetical protein